MATTTELNFLDEAYMHLDRDEEPWSVHLEVRVAGRLDAERLAEALRTAVSHHPLSRARLERFQETDVRYHWRICEELDELPLEVIDCADDQELEAARSRLLSRSVALDVAPPFALICAHHPDGDVLIANVSHAAADGLGAMRLIQSIARAYADDPDPMPDVDPLSVRDIGELAGSSSITDRLKRIGTLVEYLAESVRDPVRVSAEGADGDEAGYGFVLRHLDTEQTETLMGRRHKPATVNDLLLAGLATTIAAWNAERDGDQGRIAIMMPVNVRDSEWSDQVISNFATYVSVTVAEDAQRSMRAAVPAVAERTRTLKDQRAQGLLIDLLAFPSALPIAVKQRLEPLMPLTRDRFVDTAVLSNLGLLAEPPDFGGDAGSVSEIWFSPPGRMPLGVSVGVASLNGTVCLTLRYRAALFDRAAAEAFADAYVDTLLDR